VCSAIDAADPTVPSLAGSGWITSLYESCNCRTEERFYERAVKKKLLPGRPPVNDWFSEAVNKFENLVILEWHSITEPLAGRDSSENRLHSWQIARTVTWFH